MNDSVGGAADGTVDNHRILKGRNRHNPAWADILAHQLHYEPVSYTHLDVYKRQV